MLGFIRRARHRGARIMRSALAALAGMLLAGALGDAGATSPRNLRFERLSIEDGLTQESVLTILQDRQGFMWFGTQAGLNRYDGYRLTVYRNDPRDPGSLPDGFVNASFEDAEGRLWFGTKGGLARFDPDSGKFVRYSLLEPGAGQEANRSVNAIVADRQGLLWVGTSDGLKRFDPRSGAFTTLRHPDTRPGEAADSIVNALAFDGEGNLWVGTSGGLARLAPGAAHLEHFPALGSDPRRARILSLSMGPRETLWVGTEGGLEEWRLGAGQPQRRKVDAREGVGEVRVQALYHDAGGTLWVGTDFDGLRWRDPASGRFVSYRSHALDQHSLSDNQVAAVSIDRTGTLWVGTRFGGVSRTDLASGGFSHFSYAPDNGYQSGFRKVRDVAARADGQLWMGTSGAGLLLHDPASGRTRQLRHQPGRPASLPSDVVHSVSVVDGRLWAGTTAGLAWCDERGGDFHRVDLGLDANAALIQAVMKTRDGATWVVTRAGLYLLGPDLTVRRSWRHDPEDPASLGENRLFAMAEDKDGILWIGTDNGLDRFDRASGVFTHYRHDERDPTSLRHNRVHDVLLSRRGELWVGTAGGLHRMERDAQGRPAFRYYTITDTREAVPIGALLEDGAGRLWASTTVGISRLDPATGQYKHYTAKDGLLDGSYFVDSATRGPDGQLHFGGVNGLSSFMPDAIRDNPFPPVVRITDFLVFNKPRPLLLRQPGTVTLSHRDAVFSLEFAALHYAAPASNRYAYRLEGFDEAWVETDASKRFASYTNLDPGNYVFRVRASNKDGVWSESPATLSITILPPWWKTWWFRLLALALAGAAAFGLYWLRIRALMQQKRLLERQVNARTAELVLQKDAAERRKREAEQQKDAADQARRNIALLSDIGRRLTANLDIEAIMDTLYEHVQVLMDAPVFAVAVARADEALLDIPYAVVDGRRCAPAVRQRRDDASLATWCVEHGREVFINDLATEWGRYLPAATLDAVAATALPGAGEAPRALLYVPVVAGKRVLGALAVQSYSGGAYQRVHLDMLRTLAAYVGVALDNAQAYRQLKDVQTQLAAQEKLAALGSVVAGVAHELNTPIGNSLLMASTLFEKTVGLETAFGEAALRRSDLAGYIGASREALELIQRSLHQAAELVNSFRQVSVDQASAQRRRFDLARASQEIAATMMNKVRLAGHSLDVEVPEGIAMDSYPGPFGQVVINFVNNALLHAFEAPGGRMRLSARQLDADWVQLRFADNGRGIAPEHLARVFDPFFTTRMGQGGTGLGLSIAHTIATSLLGGAIRIESAPGEGTVFILELPQVAAEARAAGLSDDERQLQA